MFCLRFELNLVAQEMSENKKIIEIEKSSLLSLKAEVLKLKKQSEELKNREHKPTKISKSKNNSSSVNNLNHNKNQKIIEVDDSSELERSKRILEKKAKYYERMSQSKINSTLVLFKNKAENEKIEDDDEDL